LMITGSRSLVGPDAEAAVYATLDEIHRDDGPVVAFIHGDALGIDRIGERWALDRGVPVETHKPDWAAHGHDAGAKRNLDMIRVADWSP